MDAINELTPPYMHSFLIKALEEDEFDFDRQGMILTGEISASASIVRTSIIRRDESIWLGIQEEIFDFLCTTSSKYKSERGQANSNIKNIILVIAGALAAKLQIAVSVIAGFVTLAVIGVFKITKNAWCNIQNKKRDPSLHQGS
ncbi:hypothetical protein [Pseudomonas syringae]|uniref:hypothetical protein n=1 Tax=Pseudomonas syringae TaxID=317 RepID=UPI0011D24260|nr:hypothetical protein [Pseudomonas syringae]